MALEHGLLITALLLVLSVLASKASSQLGIPALLLFLLIGMLAGSDGPGGIYFDDAQLAQTVGVVALAFILFSGGLDTSWRTVRPVLRQGLLLANVGVLISMVLVGGFATIALGFTWLEGLLLGAIISATDAAAVFAVMRTSSVRLRDNLEPLIELESGCNDPIAVFLTIGLSGLITDPSASLLGLVPFFVWEMAVGLLVGYGSGYGLVLLINRVRLVSEGLYNVLTIALVLLAYGATVALHANGFLAVYVAGLVLGNHDVVHKRSLARFHDGLAWLMQIAMFLTLGLLVFPTQLAAVLGIGLLAALFLMLVARPLSVFGALAGSGLSAAAKFMVAWSGLRGAAPIVLATFPLLAGVPQAPMIFNTVFFIVLTSVLVQGTTIRWLSRRLGLNDPRQPAYHYPQEFVPTISANSQIIEVTVSPSSNGVRRSIVELGLPSGALVILVVRDADRLVPSGATVLEAGDQLLILAEPAVRDHVHAVFNGSPAPPHTPLKL